MGLFDPLNSLKSVVNQLIPTATQTQQLLAPIANVQQQVAAGLSSLPLPGANLFNTAPTVAQLGYTALSAGAGAVRESVGLTDADRPADAFTRLFAGLNAPPATAAEKRAAQIAQQPAPKLGAVAVMPVRPTAKLVMGVGAAPLAPPPSGGGGAAIILGVLAAAGALYFVVR